MRNPRRGLTDLSDDELLLEVKNLAARERDAMTQLIASIAELDARRLTSANATRRCSRTAPSVCTGRSTPHTGRIEAARAARQ
jgi:hypothetical protein